MTDSAALSVYGSAGGLGRLAKLSTEQINAEMAHARECMHRKLEAEAIADDPTLVDDPEELALRVGRLRKAHIAKMTAASLQSRARKKAEREAAREAAELDQLVADGAL